MQFLTTAVNYYLRNCPSPQVPAPANIAAEAIVNAKLDKFVDEFKQVHFNQKQSDDERKFSMIAEEFRNAISKKEHTSSDDVDVDKTSDLGFNNNKKNRKKKKQNGNTDKQNRSVPERVLIEEADDNSEVSDSEALAMLESLYGDG